MQLRYKQTKNRLNTYKNLLNVVIIFFLLAVNSYIVYLCHWGTANLAFCFSLSLFCIILLVLFHLRILQDLKIVTSQYNWMSYVKNNYRSFSISYGNNKSIRYLSYLFLWFLIESPEDIHNFFLKKVREKERVLTIAENKRSNFKQCDFYQCLYRYRDNLYATRS